MMTMHDAGHIPVLLQQVLEYLAPKPGQTFVDCTVGRGGHAVELAQAVSPNGRIIGLDLDAGNLAYAQQRVQAAGGTFVGIHESFVRMPEQLQKHNLVVSGVLADLGFSSNQMDNPARGFSFSADGPLDMRLDPHGHTTAADLIHAMSERELADVIFQYGEDPFARKIARKIVQSRQHEPIRTTAQLAGLVHEAYGHRARSSRMHPATRTFMALRIAVNDELAALQSLLEQITNAAGKRGDSWLAGDARVAIISFHSLEDRMVKQAFADLERRGLGTRLTKRPVTATEQEAQANPRARSAKLRVVQLGDNAA
jgi:16S rRNA (cytosine1402-N4)-methyltransferase